jgi:hypothetical protein
VQAGAIARKGPTLSVRIGYEASAEQFPSCDPAGAIERICRYLGLGFTGLVLHGPGGDQRRFLDQFTTDVLPGLRARAGQDAVTATGSPA